MALTSVAISEKNQQGQTALWSAAANNRPKVVQQLLMLPALDVNCRDRRHHQTPIAVAACCDHIEIVRLLLADDRTDINLEDSQGYTPLQVALKLGNQGVAEALLLHPQVNLSLLDNDGCTPLLQAAQDGMLVVVQELLVKFDVDTTACNKYGSTALHLAAQEGHLPVVKLLLSWGTDIADINTKDRDGLTPLALAIRMTIGMEHKLVVRELLAEESIDVNTTDRDGRTPLHHAVLSKDRLYLNWLLSKPTIDPNIRDREGRTALWWAACHGHRSLTATLLQHPSIDANIADYLDKRTFVCYGFSGGAVSKVFSILFPQLPHDGSPWVRRLEGQKNHNRLATESTYPPITITNILPAQTPQQALSSSPPASESTSTHSAKASRFNIAGIRDGNVQAYCDWHQSQVGNESWKVEFQKACDVALDDGLDLDQIDELNDPGYFKDRGVKWGIARRFVKDIRYWANNYNCNVNG